MYTVYRVTNLLNEKTYIGVHKTENPNDNYLGSGKAVLAAIRKYGRENFKKEVLAIFDSSREAYDLERKLTENFYSSNNYNMRLGGVGGFTRENAIKGNRSVSREARSKGGSNCARKKSGMFSPGSQKKNGSLGGLGNRGRAKSEEHKRKIRESLLRRGREAKVDAAGRS